VHGIIEASDGFGTLLVTFFGVLFVLLAWYSVFFASPGMCLLAIVVTWLFVKEKGEDQAPPPFRKSAHGLLNVFKQEGRWLFVTYLAGGTCLFTLFGILFFLSDIFDEQHKIEGVLKGLILAIPLLVMVTTSYITGSKIGKNLEKMKLIMLFCFGLITFYYGNLCFFDYLFSILVCLFIIC